MGLFFMSVRSHLRSTLAFSLVLALFFAAAAPTAFATGKSDNFPDIEGHWAEVAMSKAHSQGIIQGDGERLLPNEFITAAQVTAILVRALGGGDFSSEATPDIPSDKWYYDDVAAAQALGFLPTGISNYDAPLSRVKVFRMVMDAFSLGVAIPDLSVIAGFDDSLDYDSNTRITMANAVSCGLVVGDGKLLRAGDNITRAEFITVLFRTAEQFGTAGEILSGDPLNSVVHGDAAFKNRVFKQNMWFGFNSENISLENVRSKPLTIRSGALGKLSISEDTLLDKLTLASFGDDIDLTLSEDRIPYVVIGNGSGDIRLGGSIHKLEITGSGRAVELDGNFASVVIAGDGNQVHITKNSKVENLILAGTNCELVIDGEITQLAIRGAGADVSGKGKVTACTVTAADFDLESAGKLFVDIKDEKDFGLSGVSLVIKYPLSLPVGETLAATANLDKPLSREVQGVWHVDGKRVSAAFYNAGETQFRLEHNYEYTQDMATTSKLEFTLYYFTESGKTETLTASASVWLENYDEEYYYQFDVDRVLSIVTSVYRGNYTLDYALENDYTDTEKKIWVNAKGYSSNSQYLLWLNLAYQRLNIFEGSTGEWDLIHSCLVGSGAPGSPTPVGVWKTTYKQEYGWTTGSYTCTPVVRFIGGGFAFHSRLYYPNTRTLKDASIGFPVSAGCVRMYQEDIDWIFDNVPDGTTVVVF